MNFVPGWLLVHSLRGVVVFTTECFVLSQALLFVLMIFFCHV